MHTKVDVSMNFKPVLGKQVLYDTLFFDKFAHAEVI